ncbi:hypothetical protein BAUCODRAFT_147805 [Baudoinia panamericana UAMH 10762]|uniref:2EXR domain-containing protein n=1 Tax=Baudoinia panamericana (strain UAMH 10762) TaxID=717646 RepID=M2LP53_BAUPA|nr:uncharacterized protein BAUCODRAFT_147805 [Baudoinia panamericana UAMH 10762]EMC96157.1 hypothetical protein BAUCODRAFT_147805 [Baudoinia panamericana UAMH 10762]
MQLASTPAFLTLPKELRDSIYEYALDGNTQVHVVPTTTERTQCTAWRLHHSTTPPVATYLSLLRCCRETYREVTALLNRASLPASTTVLQLHAAYPDMQTAFLRIPRPPERLHDLHIDLKLGNMWDPVFNTPGQQEVLMRPLFEILKRYCHYGPHMGRNQPLITPLKLDVVQIVVSSAITLSELDFVFDSPRSRLAMLFGRFKNLLMKLARSGILFDAIHAFEVRLRADLFDGDWHRMPVTSNMWDEQDYVFYHNAGFSWDANAITR